MRFGQSLNVISIPEWKQCYLNYEILKIFVMIIKQLVEAINECDIVIKKYIDNDANQLQRLTQTQIHNLAQIRLKLIAFLNQQNQLFYQIYLIQAQITQLFYQMKVMQIQEKFQFCCKFSKKRMKRKLRHLFLTYIQYSYIEITYISEMRQANIEAQRKILKKHKKYAKKMIETPQPCHDKINRMAYIQQDYMNKIEDLYVENHQQMPSKEARQFLREAAHKTQTNYWDYFLSGIGIGATFILLGTLIFIIQYQNLSIQNASAAFSRDFPTWRGIALFILYIWILGFDVYCFQKYKISHRLIFNFDDHHYSSSSSVFKIAGFFTAIFMVTFLVYLLLVSNIFNYPNFQFQYLVLGVWLALGVYLVMPLPIFNYQGRIYAIKLMLRSLASPIIGVDFTITWMTDQWISMATPLRDLAYTACYYTRLDFRNIKVNPCKDSSSFEVVLLVVVIAISYRILQCLRMGYQQKKYLMTPHMGNTFKYVASLVTSILSYVYNLGYPNLLGIWIISSSISTIYSYVWDLKYDWALLQSNSRNWLLRKYITFEPKRNYYIVIVTNFIMRLAWTMTISPSVAKYFGNSSLLTFVTGSIEIIRRGIWNLLRVQRQHLKNCIEFRAVPDMKNLETQLETNDTQMQFLGDGNGKVGKQVRQTIKKAYSNLIKKKIQNRDMQQKIYNQDYQDSKVQQVKRLKSQIKQYRKSLNEKK